jgi:phosphoglycerate dehydrogenase-like enzyme
MDSTSVVAVTSRSFSNNKELVKKLKQRYKNVLLNESGQTLKGKELLSFLSSADKAIIGIEDMSKENLSTLPKLKVISKYGVGLNNIDLEFCKSNNIKLGFIPGVNKQSVAEFALTLILLGLRKIHTNHIQISKGIWPQNKGFELYKKKVGILGFGNIGQTLVALLQSFRCEIIFFDQHIFQPDEIKDICNSHNINPSTLRQANFNEVLAESDVLSIHLPLNSKTKNIINANALLEVKPHVVLVNTARGGIVQEKDLIYFLSSNPDAFAAFDVFAKEPAINNPLFNLDNFFGTSHRSSLTFEGINSMGMAAINGLDDNTYIN